MTQKLTKSKGRRIALYPGAFRPPHAAHYAAVRHLLALPQIDEVVVIIANRCRVIPGTTQAFDTEVAQRVWAMYLQGVENVRVEISPHNAVVHALGYFTKVQSEDTLLFCLGEADFEDGDDRFRTLQHLSVETGINAEVLSAPTGSIPIRATVLREALVKGEDQKGEFFSALPTHLTRNQQEVVWSLCQQNMREIGDVLKEKVMTLLEGMNLGPIQDLWNTHFGKMDPVFCLQLKDNQRLFIKYAGDTVGAGTLGQRLSPKPRRRLATERRALRWLKGNMRRNVEFPEIVHFDKSTWTLVTTEVCPGGTSLESQLQKGNFDPVIAGKASQFLAECHTISHPVPPLWGSAEADRQHWKRILALKTSSLEVETCSTDIRNNLGTLLFASGNAEENCFVHLDFQPKNIFISGDNIGIIDFELSSNIGDPAFDLGIFLGHYVHGILASAKDASWKHALKFALQSYQKGVGKLWKSMDSRVIAFTGTTLLNIQAREDVRPNQDLAGRMMQAGIFLLAQVAKKHIDAERILCQAINDFSH